MRLLSTIAQPDHDPKTMGFVQAFLSFDRWAPRGSRSRSTGAQEPGWIPTALGFGPKLRRRASLAWGPSLCRWECDGNPPRGPGGFPVCLRRNALRDKLDRFFKAVPAGSSEQQGAKGLRIIRVIFFNFFFEASVHE